ncbi:hypothetical protein ABT187_42510 [Streptomyces sp. NPDC001817]|uniref:hypothetical protein n=1 Tax=Streptomyces sp. NPDC001817 TaxID=3154398 RepID=UPI0033319AEA
MSEPAAVPWLRAVGITAVEMEGVLSADMIAGAELRGLATRPNPRHARHTPASQTGGAGFHC